MSQNGTDRARDCAICDKHRGLGPLAGPVIYGDDLLVVTHRSATTDGLTVPGYLFVETRRHVDSLAAMTETEALAVAGAVWRASRALHRELAPEFVFSAIAGRGVAHFHQHLFVRPHGMPEVIAWNDVDSWDERPLVTTSELALLCSRLRSRFV